MFSCFSASYVQMTGFSELVASAVLPNGHARRFFLGEVAGFSMN